MMLLDENLCLNNCVHLIIFKLLNEHLEIITTIKDIAICVIVDGDTKSFFRMKWTMCGSKYIFLHLSQTVEELLYCIGRKKMCCL